MTIKSVAFMLFLQPTATEKSNNIKGVISTEA
ncbi:hypothetical protein QF042_000327 [Pedobacter sp. W3I1]|nr:hypothetical protein [Pedobacter sp. W3I1]